VEEIADYYDERTAEFCIQPAASCGENPFISLECYGQIPGCPYYD
jgi:hypothetical protein